MMTFSEIRYYYYRDAHRAPRVTICRVCDTQGRYGYGWSICTEPSPHPGDRIQFDWAGNDVWIRGGRSIARGRATAALTGTRGVECLPYGTAPCFLYRRPIRRAEAIGVLVACHAFALLNVQETRDVRGFPLPILPPQQAVPSSNAVTDTVVANPHAFAPSSQVSARRLTTYRHAILAGADANELARLELLEAFPLTDAAGYLQVPEVYSEALERFVTESEAL